MTLEQARPGMLVTYIPPHAHGDASHPDAQQGIVKSKNDIFVFVTYSNTRTTQATRAEDLIEG